MTESQPSRQRRIISLSSTEQQLLDIITQPKTSAPPQIPRQENKKIFFCPELSPKAKSAASQEPQQGTNTHIELPVRARDR